MYTHTESTPAPHTCSYTGTDLGRQRNEQSCLCAGWNIMNTGPTGLTRSFKMGAPADLFGNGPANLANLEAHDEEMRRAIYGLQHTGELHIQHISPHYLMTLQDAGLAAFMEQRGVGIDIGYARAIRHENPARYAGLIATGRTLGPERLHLTRPMIVPVATDPMLTRPLELDAHALSQLSIGELKHRLWLRVGNMPGLHMSKKMLVKMLIACERTRLHMQRAITESNQNLPLHLP